MLSLRRVAAYTRNLLVKQRQTTSFRCYSVVNSGPRSGANESKNFKNKPSAQKLLKFNGPNTREDRVIKRIKTHKVEEFNEDTATKRVLAPDADQPKLHKVLAQAGIGSRRGVEQIIEEGRVTVNGVVAHTAQRILITDRIAVDGKLIKTRVDEMPTRVIAYYKPLGEVVTRNDPQERPTVFNALPRLREGKWQNVGRLDLNSEGLLLFTTSGDLANQLMHPRFGIDREYEVRVFGTLEDSARAKLLKGVMIEGQMAAFTSVTDSGGSGMNKWYRVVINEGRNREVRKLFDAVGLQVSRLIRIRYGNVVLPRDLDKGAWFELRDGDITRLRSIIDRSHDSK